jgi:DNA polymerase
MTPESLEELKRKLIKLKGLYRLQIAGEEFIPLPSTSGRWEQLEKIKREVERCTKCPLHKTRLNPVFGEGSPYARLMLVGEGPGEMEDRSGRPFVGRSGQLLTKLLDEIGIKRTEVYIGNIVKCRPPKNRTPKPEEAVKCKPYLLRQIEVISPKVIMALGKTALTYLLNRDLPISRVRGQQFEWNGRIVIPTFHPSYLLRNPDALPIARKDFLLARQLLEKEER